MKINSAFLYLGIWLWIMGSSVVAQKKNEQPTGSLATTVLYADHWAYTYIRLFQDRGYLRELYYSLKPYNRSAVAQAISSLSSETLTASEKYWKELLEEEFSRELSLHGNANAPEAQAYSKAEFEAKGHSELGHFEPDFFVNPEIGFTMKYLAASIRGRIDNGLLNDPAYTGRRSGRLAARIEDGYASLQLGKVHIFAGRLAQSWGPFNNKSLILSSNPYTYDQFGLNFETNHIAFHSSFAKLNSMTYNAQTSDRYFSAHRLDVRFDNGIQFGISETVVYGQPGQTMEFSYLNPFNVFAGSQLNDGKEANENIAFDFYLPLRPVQLMGQFLIDDFVLDGPDKPAPNRKTSSDRLGFLFGIQTNDLFINDSRWSLNYERIGSYAYNVKQKRPWQSYTFDGRGLGNEANDREAIGLNLQYFPIPKWLFEADASLTRQGERGLSSNDFEDSTFNKIPFPSGTVENRFSISAGALYQHGTFAIAEARVGFDHITNFKHIKNKKKDALFFLVRLNVNLDKSISLQ